MIIEIEVDDKDVEKAKTEITKLGYEIKEAEPETEETAEGEPEVEESDEMDAAGEEMKRQFMARTGNPMIKKA